MTDFNSKSTSHARRGSHTLRSTIRARDEEGTEDRTGFNSMRPGKRLNIRLWISFISIRHCSLSATLSTLPLTTSISFRKGQRRSRARTRKRRDVTSTLGLPFSSYQIDVRAPNSFLKPITVINAAAAQGATRLQLAGGLGPKAPPRKTLLFRYQTAVWCVEALNSA